MAPATARGALDRGGVRQVLTSARWSTDFDAAIWNQVTAVGEPNGGEDNAESVFRVGPALPTESEPRLLALYGSRETNNPTVAHWRMIAYPPPQEPAPEEIQGVDSRIGGQAGLARIVARVLPDASPVEARYHILLIVDASDWHCRVLPREAGEEDAARALAGSGGAPKIEQVGYRFQSGGELAIEEVELVYHHQEDHFHVRCLASGHVTVGHDWLLHGRLVAERVVAALFQHVES